MIFFLGLAMITILGAFVIGGLTTIVRADLRSQALPSRTAAGKPRADADRAHVAAWDSNLMLALSGLSAPGEGIPHDAFLHVMAPYLAKMYSESDSTASTLAMPDPLLIREAARTPVEDLQLTVRAYNRVKRLGVHDVGSLLMTPFPRLNAPEAGLTGDALEDVQSRVVVALTKDWWSGIRSVGTSAIPSRTQPPAPASTIHFQVFQGSNGLFRIRVRMDSRVLVLEDTLESRDAALRVAEDIASGVYGADVTPA